MNGLSQDECTILGHVVRRTTQVEPSTEEEPQLLLACNNGAIEESNSSPTRPWVDHARAIDESNDLTRACNQLLNLPSILGTDAKRVFDQVNTFGVHHIIPRQQQVKIEWSLITLFTHIKIFSLLADRCSLSLIFRFLVELSSLLSQFYLERF